jgi:hypothetical protein
MIYERPMMFDDDDEVVDDEQVDPSPLPGDDVDGDSDGSISLADLGDVNPEVIPASRLHRSTIPMSTRKTPSAPLTQAARAAQLGVSSRTLREWLGAGLSEDEMRQRAERQRERVSGSGDMSQARLRKLQAEAECAECDEPATRGPRHGRGYPRRSP